MINLNIAFILSLIISFYYPLYCQLNFDELFHSLEKAESSAQKDLCENIILSLTDIDTTIAKAETERLLKLTSKFKDPFCYNHTLLFYSRFGSTAERRNVLYTTYRLAKDIGDIDMMARSQIGLSEVYQAEYRYDSSIVSIIKARDLFEKINNTYERVTVLQKIGDLYFLAALYDKAEKYYKDVLRLQGEPKAWRDWRKYVITNNLGLIETKRKNYDRAIEYFDKALVDLLVDKKYSLNYMDTIRIVYSYNRLTDLYIDKKDYKKAWEYCFKGFSAESNYNRTEPMASLYLTKGKLYFYSAMYDSSLFYLNKAKNMNQTYRSLALSIEIQKYMADAYAKINDYKNAWLAKNKYVVFSDSLNRIQNIFSGVQLISDDYSKRTETELDIYKVRQNFFIIILLVAALSVILILFIYLKLQKAHRHLIKNSIELIHAETDSVKLKLLSNAKPGSKQIASFNKVNELTASEQTFEPQEEEIVESIKMKDFAAHLTEVMNREEIFRDSNLTLDNLALLTNTNRHFLSKVINNKFGMHFSSYINQLRIKKAVLILSQKEDVNIYKLEGIAKRVGFNNRTTFITAFKNYTGVTPSFFIKNIPKE